MYTIGLYSLVAILKLAHQLRAIPSMTYAPLDYYTFSQYYRQGTKETSAAASPTFVEATRSTSTATLYPSIVLFLLERVDLSLEPLVLLLEGIDLPHEVNILKLQLPVLLRLVRDSGLGYRFVAAGDG